MAAWPETRARKPTEIVTLWRLPRKSFKLTLMENRFGRPTIPRWTYLLPPAAYYGLIFFLSAQSRFPVQAPFRFFDKIAHFGVYAGFGIILIWSWRRMVRQPGSSRILGPFLIGLAGGVLDEIHQIFVPGRNPDVFDAAADAIGVLFGIALWTIVVLRKKQ
jgi:VanZ family protein